MFVLLDLSAAFDTIDHRSYLRGLGLHLEFGIWHCPGLHYIKVAELSKFQSTATLNEV